MCALLVGTYHKRYDGHFTGGHGHGGIFFNSLFSVQMLQHPDRAQSVHTRKKGKKKKKVLLMAKKHALECFLWLPHLKKKKFPSLLAWKWIHLQNTQVYIRRNKGLLDALKFTVYLSCLDVVQGVKKANRIEFIRGGVCNEQLRI